MGFANNVIPAWALQNPYQVPYDDGWYWWDEDEHTRAGPYNTKADARRLGPRDAKLPKSKPQFDKDGYAF